MAQISIDPVSRVEGHLRVELEVEDGAVSDAWVSGGCYRGMEQILEGRTPSDAAQIVQRVCGVCPVSHAQASAIATEKAFGLVISNNARIIRNIMEAAQFLQSHILWFYNLNLLDYVNPFNALEADPYVASDLASTYGLTINTNLMSFRDRLDSFALNGQLSIFSGNWFPTQAEYRKRTSEYAFSSGLDLVLMSHYVEALEMQAKVAEINALLGGKMPHVTTIVPGGTAFVPSIQDLIELESLVDEVYDWVSTTMLPDTLVMARFYPEILRLGGGCGRYLSWGVFENQSMKHIDRYLPMGVLDEDFNLSDADEKKISEYAGSSWYVGRESLSAPSFVSVPEYTSYDTSQRYSWVKAPAYDGRAYETGALARVLVAYLRGVPFVINGVDAMLERLNKANDFSILQSVYGRSMARQVETLYIATLIKEWVQELIEAVQGGDLEFFRSSTAQSGQGSGFWEAPRGALYHSEKISNGRVSGYQIIAPTTWNLAPRNAQGEKGPLEQALIGVEVKDTTRPINVLRTIHSFDPCATCAVHVASVKHEALFSANISPYGVR